MVNQFFQRHNSMVLFSSVSLLVLIIDQLTKYVVSILQPQLNLKILLIHYVQNTGAGFGILRDQANILTFISLAVALAMIFMYKHIPKERVPQVLFAVFLGGVVGNLLDRLFRGYVVDFIDLNFWPTFNVADAAISLAAVGLVVYFWKK